MIPIHFHKRTKIVTCGCGTKFITREYRTKFCPRCARKKYPNSKMRVILEESRKRLERTVKVYTEKEIKEFQKNHK